MNTIVAMLIICFVPAGNGKLREAWRFSQDVTLKHCLTMNQVFSAGGQAGVITVRCGPR